MPSDKVIQHVPAEVREGLAKALYSVQFACLHTGIIYHNISPHARLLIICFCVGVVGNGRIQVSSNSNPQRLRGGDAKRRMGFWSCYGESSCDEETAVWNVTTFSRMCVRAYA